MKFPLVLPSNKLPAPSTKKPVPVSYVVGGDAPRAILPLLLLLTLRVEALRLNVCAAISRELVAPLKER